MRIDKLTLENFRCFESREFEFAPQFNILIGDNGAGKTTVLDALAVSLGAVRAGFISGQFHRIEPQDIRIVSGGSVDLPTLTQKYPVQVKAWGDFLGKSVIWSRNIESETRNNGKSTSLRKIVAQVVESLDSSQITLPVIAYYRVERTWEKPRMIAILRKGSEAPEKRDPPKYSEISTRFNGYKSCFYAKTIEKDVRRLLKTLTQSEIQRGSRNNVLYAICEAVRFCLPVGWDDFYYDVLLDELVVSRNNRTHFEPTRLLSHGQRNMIAMVVDLAYRCAQLNSHLRGKVTAETPGVVLIDEIDLHLHPQWQRSIVESLRKAFPKVQFIATTHSPLIIQSLQPGELIDVGDGVAGDYVNKSVEDLLQFVMDVPGVQRSAASLERFEVAKKYYELLKQGKSADLAKKTEIKERLDALMIPYMENEAYAAYVAFLHQERMVSGIDSGEGA